MTTMEFLNSINPDDRFVSETAQSYFDQSLYLAEGIQVTYNETFQAIGLEELAMVMEADEEGLPAFDATAKETSDKDKKTIISKITDFFKKVWSYIKAFFNKIINTIKAYFSKYKANFSKYFAEAIKYFKDYNGKEITFGSFYTNFSLIGVYANCDQYIFKGIKQIAETSYNALIKTSNLNSDVEAYEKTFNKDEIFKSLGLGGFGDKSLREAFKKFLFRKSETVDIKTSTIKENKYISMIEMNAFKDKHWLDVVKKHYNDSKKFIDDLMKKAKDVVNKNSDNIKIFMKGCRTLLMLMSQGVAASNDAIKDFSSKTNSVAKRIIIKFFQLSGRNPKEILGESTEDYYSDYMFNEAVDLAFDWI